MRQPTDRPERGQKAEDPNAQQAPMTARKGPTLHAPGAASAASTISAASAPAMAPAGNVRSGHQIADERIISVEQQQAAFRSAQRHTTRVKWLKLSLPVFVLVAVAGFVSWVIGQKPEPVEVKIEKASLQKDELIMQDPKLNGFTDGSAYEVTAKRAIQQVATPDVINLESIIARIADEKDQWANITAKDGVFNQTKELLDLSGSVNVETSLGYNFVTEEVKIDMPKRYMRTTSPIDITSKDVHLKAQQLEAIDNGELFRFKGNVKLRIDAAMLNKGKTQSGTKVEGAQKEEGAQ